jgi:HK97 family phage portal protein
MIGLDKSKDVEKRQTYKMSSPDIVELFAPISTSSAGVVVNDQTSLQATAVWSCIRLLAESVASLPLNTFERTKNGKEKAYENSLFSLLKYAPNPEMTSFSFFEMAVVHLLMRGNFYAEKDYGTWSPKPLALWPIPNDRVMPYRDETTNKLLYRISLPDGTYKTFGQDKMLHISGMGFNGITGLSAIDYFRQSIGLSLAAEEFGATFFGNGARPGGILEHPLKLGDKAYKRLEKSFNDRHKGLANAQRLSILEEGMKYHALQVAPNDAQFLQTREYQTVDICRIFNVPPEMIGVATKTSMKQEDMSIKFVTFCLRPWLVRIEAQLKTSMFGVKDRQKYFCEFNTNALLRGDFKSRMEGYAIARQNGWLNADEIRAMDNMNPLPKKQGKIYIAPMNYIPLDKMRELADSQIKEQESGEQSNPGSPKQDLADAKDGSPNPKRSLLPLQADIAERIVKRHKIDTASGNLKLKRFRSFIEDCTRSYCAFAEMEHSVTVDKVEALLQQNGYTSDALITILEDNDA